MSDVARLMELARQYVPPPANVDVPAVTPLTAGVGDLLNCTMGNWDHQPDAYAYQWMANGITVGGALPEYVVADTDAGTSITCMVTASNVIGSTQVISNAVAIPAAGGMRAQAEGHEERAGPPSARGGRK